MQINCSLNEMITLICNVLSAFGTVAAVIVALWLAKNNNKPKLSVSASVSVLSPDNIRYLSFYCVNRGYQPLLVVNLSFSPNQFKTLRMMMPPEFNVRELSTSALPAVIKYSEDIRQYFDLNSLRDENFKKFLGGYRWIAKIKLERFWRIVGVTNIQEFEGKLSKSLIEEILNIHFSSKIDN